MQFTQPGTKYELPESPIKALTTTDREDLFAAMQHISSEDRDTWVQVGMALHSTLAGSEAFTMARARLWPGNFSLIWAR
ncbi:MAG: PriCT-2 domain-containing protein [Burkholderiaceae bacterium]